MQIAQLYLHRFPATFLSRGIATVGLLLAALAFGGCSDTLTPEDPTLTGEWIAAKDPARTFFPEADTFRFVLVQTDTLVTGTWSATGPSGVVVKPDQQVGGRIVAGRIELGLRYSRYDHGCTGPLRECYDLYDRVIGQFRSSNEVHGQVIGPPHPWLPDSDLPIFAEWTLLRRQ